MSSPAASASSVDASISPVNKRKIDAENFGFDEPKPKKAKSKPYKPKLDPNWIQDVDLDSDLPEFVMLRALKMMVQLPAKVGPHDVTLIFPRKSGNTKGTLVEGKDLAFDKDNDIVLPENMPQRLIMGAEEDAAALFGAVRQRIKEDSKDALKQLKQLASGERKCASPQRVWAPSQKAAEQMLKKVNGGKHKLKQKQSKAKSIATGKGKGASKKGKRADDDEDY